MIQTMRLSVMQAASLIAKKEAGSLLAVFGYNSGPDQYVQLHDSATLPADGDQPVASIFVPTGNFNFDVPVAGFPFSSGIVICNSSTAFTKTLGATDLSITAIILA